MVLALDIGNTEITLGLFDGDELERSWRLTTRPDQTPDEWAVVVRALFDQAGLDITQVTATVLASVVPSATEAVADALLIATGTTPLVIGPETPLPVKLDVEEPQTVGADRVVNTVAAMHLFRVDVIVVDFGTATTLDCITRDGVFLGGIIAPGLRTSGENLARRAAKLMPVELAPPARAMGRRTEDCIRAGLVYGAADAVDGLVRRLKAEWPTRTVPKVIATGGYAALVAKYSSEIEEVHPDLTLRGLQIAHRLLAGPAAV
ncbi:MAG TPA: type III pantothenate kinase [Gemmatimonadales bacterium]|nr:type III pantothenate kinase [Gemmatimonadales bacterium]